MGNIVKKLLTIDDLYNFYANNSKRNRYYSADDENGELRVQVDGTLKFEESDKDTEGLLKVHFQACHTGRNLNSSKIEYENMEKALPSFANRPVLGYLWKDDNGEWQFYSHNAHEEDGEIVYDEVPVGVVPESCNAEIKYDKDKDKDYVEIDGYIYEEYSHAADVLRREGECAVSVELAFRDVAFDAKEKILNIKDFYFAAITILGKDEETGEEVKPGMSGANVKIADFQNNSVITDDLVEALNKLNENLSKFNINNQRKEESVMNHFEELLQKYNVTAEDIDFEYEGLSDEELDAAFAEKFDSEPSDPESTDGGEEGTEGGEEGNEGTNPESEPDGEYALILPNGEKKTFSLSMDDKYAAISNLVNATYAEEDNDWYRVIIYDDDSIVVMHSWWTENAYRQKYKREGDEFSLVGDRVEVHQIWVTDEEDKAVEEMKANYAEISEKLSKYESEPDKAAIFESDEWSLISETDDFKKFSLQENHFDLSVDEIRTKLDEMVLLAAKKSSTSKVEFAKVSLSSSAKPTLTDDDNSGVASRYGTIFKR